MLHSDLFLAHKIREVKVDFAEQYLTLHRQSLIPILIQSSACLIALLSYTTWKLSVQNMLTFFRTNSTPEAQWRSRA